MALSPAVIELGLAPAELSDSEALSQMAWDIWNRYYFPEILSRPAIRHLWHRAYRPDLISEDIRRGTPYYWIKRQHQPVGFVAHRLDSVHRQLWLSKLYILPEHHGLGIGDYALNRVAQAANELQAHEILLYVFKKNARAIRAYCRAGFEIAHEEVSEAGNGFCYDDYVMIKTLVPEVSPDVGPEDRADPKRR